MYLDYYLETRKIDFEMYDRVLLDISFCKSEAGGKVLTKLNLALNRQKKLKVWFSYKWLEIQENLCNGVFLNEKMIIRDNCNRLIDLTKADVENRISCYLNWTSLIWSELAKKNTYCLVTGDEIIALDFLMTMTDGDVYFCKGDQCFFISGSLKSRMMKELVFPLSDEVVPAPEVVEGDTVELLDGNRLKIGRVFNNEGAEGVIYQIDDCTLAKIYRGGIYKDTINKIDILTYLTGIDAYVTKPLSLLKKEGKFTGYLMENRSGYITLNRVFLNGSTAGLEKYFDCANRGVMIAIAIELVTKVLRMNQNGLLVGDYNLSNFMVNPDTMDIVFIDCDGFYISSWPNQVIKNCSVDRTFDYTKLAEAIKAEYYYLTITVFEILTCHMEPFYPMEDNKPARYIFDFMGETSPFQSMHDILPGYINAMFEYCFVTKHEIMPEDLLVNLYHYKQDYDNKVLNDEAMVMMPRVKNQHKMVKNVNKQSNRDESENNYSNLKSDAGKSISQNIINSSRKSYPNVGKIKTSTVQSKNEKKNQLSTNYDQINYFEENNNTVKKNRKGKGIVIILSILIFLGCIYYFYPIISNNLVLKESATSEVTSHFNSSTYRTLTCNSYSGSGQSNWLDSAMNYNIEKPYIRDGNIYIRITNLAFARNVTFSNNTQNNTDISVSFDKNVDQSYSGVSRTMESNSIQANQSVTITYIIGQNILKRYGNMKPSDFSIIEKVTDNIANSAILNVFVSGMEW